MCRSYINSPKHLIIFTGDMSDPSFQISRKDLPTLMRKRIAFLYNSLAVWTQEYSARDTYGPAIGGWPASQSLNAAFWHKVTEAFASNDAIFQKFISLKTRGVNVSPCTGNCKTTTICNLRALRAENNCVSYLNYFRPFSMRLTYLALSGRTNSWTQLEERN